MEDWVTIKNLKAKDTAISNRQIARQLGISHNTVKASLERTLAPEYNKKGKRQSALEPFREIIFEMVNVKKFRGTRILNELRIKRLTGRYGGADPDSHRSTWQARLPENRDDLLRDYFEVIKSSKYFLLFFLLISRSLLKASVLLLNTS